MMKRFFTLIELLAVVAIIAILAAMTLGLIKYGNLRAKEFKTKATMAKIEAVLGEYKQDRGAYPSTLWDHDGDPATPMIAKTEFVWDVLNRGGVEKWRHSQTNSPYASTMADHKAFQDGWKQEFFYKSPGDHGPYDLWSVGDDPDLTVTADDITNWSRN